MKDNEIFRIILPIISTGLTALGYSNVTVQQGDQPTQQGVPSNPVVTVTKIGNHRYGFRSWKDSWNGISSSMDETSVQKDEVTFQVNGLVTQNPSDTTIPTASDLVNSVAQVLSSRNVVKQLVNADLAILRITDVRNPYFIDDRQRFEASPSFDFTLENEFSDEMSIDSFNILNFAFYRV
jgi:hypothetical protein